MMDWSKLSTLNAFLNAISAALLLAGYIQIKRGSKHRHKRLMLMALTVSALFLVSYLLYHSRVGSVPYPHHDWTRTVYFIILIPHIILAALMVPFIAAAVWFALTEKYENHVRIVTYLWPVWMYVSVSGIIVYLMLYVL
jgi:uncharacterized membrane protein YozB (DUF420 family)